MFSLLHCPVLFGQVGFSPSTHISSFCSKSTCITRSIYTPQLRGSRTIEFSFSLTCFFYPDITNHAVFAFITESKGYLCLWQMSDAWFGFFCGRAGVWLVWAGVSRHQTTTVRKMRRLFWPDHVCIIYGDSVNIPRDDYASSPCRYTSLLECYSIFFPQILLPNMLAVCRNKWHCRLTEKQIITATS